MKMKKDELQKLRERKKYLEELKQIEADIEREKIAISDLKPNFLQRMFKK